MKGDECVYSFGDFTLHTGEHALRKGEEHIHLRPKVYETLLYLVEHQGNLVKKDELLDALWADVVVTENTLSQCIDAVRKALNDRAQHPLYIQTVPRLGFKFIADVKEVRPDEFIEKKSSKVDDPNLNPAVPSNTFFRNRFKLALGAAAIVCLAVAIGWGLRNSSKQAFESVAVLPFTNLNGDTRQDYFADGMTEALIANLGKIKALRVISRTSSIAYKETPTPLPEIAAQLGVDAVIEGSVLQADERVRITAKLINAKTDRLLWVQSYERDIQDILTLQGELAQAIVTEIEVELTPLEQANVTVSKPVNPKSYDAYLKGRYFWNKRTGEGFEKAKEQFLTAIEHDSTYAPAYAGLADTYTLLRGYGILPSREALSYAKQYATKAIELDETLADAHVAMAANLSDEWDWDGAGREFQRAIQLNPNYETAHHWYSNHLIRTGLLDEGIDEIKKARKLAPLSPRIRVDLGRAYYFARDYDLAITQYEETLELHPNFAPAHSLLGLVLLEKGLYKEAIHELREGMGIRKGDLSIWLGYAFAVAGEIEQAKNLLNKWKQRRREWNEGATNIALIYVGLGNKDVAFEWLEKAYNERDGNFFTLKCSPYWDTLRADSRYQNLLRRLGLPEDNLEEKNKSN